AEEFHMILASKIPRQTTILPDEGDLCQTTWKGRFVNPVEVTAAGASSSEQFLQVVFHEQGGSYCGLALLIREVRKECCDPTKRRFGAARLIRLVDAVNRSPERCIDRPLCRTNELPKYGP